MTGFTDFTLLFNNYGVSVPIQVPEPTLNAILLLLFAYLVASQLQWCIFRDSGQ